MVDEKIATDFSQMSLEELEMFAMNWKDKLPEGFRQRLEQLSTDDPSRLTFPDHDGGIIKSTTVNQKRKSGAE